MGTFDFVVCCAVSHNVIYYTTAFSGCQSFFLEFRFFRIKQSFFWFRFIFVCELCKMQWKRKLKQCFENEKSTSKYFGVLIVSFVFRQPSCEWWKSKVIFDQRDAGLADLLVIEVDQIVGSGAERTAALCLLNDDFLTLGVDLQIVVTVDLELTAQFLRQDKASQTVYPTHNSWILHGKNTSFPVASFWKNDWIFFKFARECAFFWSAPSCWLLLYGIWRFLSIYVLWIFRNISFAYYNINITNSWKGGFLKKMLDIPAGIWYNSLRCL